MPNIRQFLATLTDRRPGDLFARVQAAAHDAATSPYNRDQPTAAQLESNSYRTGRVDIQGLPVRIENPRGTRREKPGRWSNLMQHHYGDIAGTKGNDGDPVDVFIGPFPELSVVYVVNQVGKGGDFDEHKVCIGFQNEADARTAYLSAYAPGWDGLASITRATVTQLKWWLKFGDKSRPFTPDVLPYEGQTTMDKVLWNAQAEPVTKPLHTLMYELRVEDADAGLMLDAVSMAEQMTDPDIEAMPLLDAMVVEVGRLQPKMEALQRIMAAAGGTVKPTEVSISDPVRYRGVAQVMVVFSMDDGQTVSVWFHNPDTTPAKLMPLDELISWKWMLNKKDVTIVVAPEKGRDLNPREVARRMMRLVERNTEAFKKANARTAERAALLQSLDTEIAGLETTLADLNRKIEVAKVEAEDRKAEAARKFEIYRFGDGETGKVTAAYAELGTMKNALDDLDRPAGTFYGKDKDVVYGDVIYSFAAETAMLKASKTVNKEQFAKLWDDMRRWANKEHGQYGSDWLVRNAPAYLALQHGISMEWAGKALAQWMQGDAGVFPGEESYDDFLAAVVFSLSEKGGMTPAEAKKLTDGTNLVHDGFADKVPADQVADQILAANKRSPNVERAYRIAERLIAFYGWSKSAENEYPEQGINLDAPRGADRWVFLGEEGGRLIAEKPSTMSFNFFTDESTDAELAANIDLADFEAELDTGVDGLLGSDEEFAGKTVAFAYAAEVLRKGAVAAGATVQFGDFNGSTSASMFDKATNPTPYADVSVYGITAQIGVDGRVLARASIDEEGKITILKGAGGTEEVGTPADAGDVREFVKMLMAEPAAQPVVEPAAEPVSGASGAVYAPFAAVEYIKRFMKGNENAVIVRVTAGTFSRLRLLSSGSKSAITRATNELMAAAGDAGEADIEQKVIYASRLGPLEAAELLRDEGVEVTNQMPDGLVPLTAGSLYDVAILGANGKPDSPIRYWDGCVFKGLESWNSVGMTLDIKAKFLHEKSSTSVTVPMDDVAEWVKSGWIKPAGAATATMGVSEGEDVPEGEDPIAAVDAAYKFADATDEFKRWVADSIEEAEYSPFVSSKSIDEAAKKHGARVSWDIKRVMDSISGEEPPESAGLLDSVAGKKIVIDDQVPVKDRPFGAKQVAFVSWGTNNGAMLVDIDREARAEFGGGTFMAPAGELPGGPRLVRLDPKAMTMQVAQNSDGAMGWTEPVKVKGIKVYNVGKFTGAFRVAALDSVEPGDVVLDAAEGWDSIVGTIKKGAKIVGRAHVGGDGKSMVFVGKSGNTRVQFVSKVDGVLREHLWSEDDAGRLVDSLFTEPANGIAKAVSEAWTKPLVSADGLSALCEPRGMSADVFMTIDYAGGKAVVGATLERNGVRATLEWKSGSQSYALRSIGDRDGEFDGNHVVLSKLLEAFVDWQDKSAAEVKAPADNDLTRLEALRKLAPEEREAIRSDDPKIIEKLQAKLNYLVANGEMMRKANKLVRKEDRAGLAAMGFTGRTLEALFQKDFAGRTGFADYQMTNNNGVIRTTRLRLEELMAQQETKEEPQPVAPAAGGKFRYALVNRPADIGAIPKVAHTVEPRPAPGQPHHDMARHGILVTERELTDEEVKSFELAPLVEGAALDVLAGKIAENMGRYAAQYVEVEADDPAQFREKVLDLVRTVGNGIRYSVAAPDALVDRVLVLLQDMAAASNPAEETKNPEPTVNPDASFLQSMIDGSINLLDPELVTKLEPLFEQYASDEAMMDLLNRAANAYSDAAVAAAKKALGV